MNQLPKKYFICLFFLSSTVIPQTNRISLGVFFGSGLGLNANYSYELNSSLFIRPNISALISRDGKELYSFMNYEFDLGYYILNNPYNKIYFTLGGSYNPFLLQTFEGNASFISDIHPPNYFRGKTREDCFGMSVKIGALGITYSGFSLGLEVKYLILFPKIKYNYSPVEYSLIKDNETIKMILLGACIGFNF